MNLTEWAQERQREIKAAEAKEALELNREKITRTLKMLSEFVDLRQFQVSEDETRGTVTVDGIPFTAEREYGHFNLVRVIDICPQCGQERITWRIDNRETLVRFILNPEPELSGHGHYDCSQPNDVDLNDQLAHLIYLIANGE